MPSNRWTQALVVLLVVIASAWLLGLVLGFAAQFSSLLMLFFLSWLVAFILRPVARWLSRRGLPYGGAVAVVYLALGVLLVLGGVYLVPVIVRQIENLVNTVQNSGGLIDQGEDWLRQLGLKDADIQQIYSNIANSAQAIIVQTLQGMADLLGKLANFLFQLLMVGLLSFYFMKDGERIGNNFLSLMPPRWQDELRLAALGIEKSFGGFVRGQLVFALLYTVLTAIIMVIPPFQLDLWLIASLVAGIAMLIPLIGGFLALAPPMLVLVLDPEKAHLWWAFALALFFMQTIMINVLSPRIMSSAIGIHPIYVWAAVLIGAQVAGLWGALFGIPIAGAINLIGRPLLRRIRHQSNLYKESVLPTPTTASFLTGPLAASMASQLQVPPVPAQPVESHPHPASEPRVPETPPAPAPLDALLEDEVAVRPQPTLSARAWRALSKRVSKMRGSSRARAQARPSRQ